MRLRLFHPALAQVSCKECKRHLYDPKTWKLQTYKAGPQREERPCLRPKGVPLPCQTDDGCPKGAPERERDFVLTARNLQCLAWYLEARAMTGALLSPAERRDPIVRRNVAILDRLYREAERERDMERLGAEVAHGVLLMLPRR